MLAGRAAIKLRPDSVVDREIPQIPEILGQLDDIVERATGGFDCSPWAVENVPRLRSDRPALVSTDISPVSQNGWKIGISFNYDAPQWISGDDPRKNDEFTSPTKRRIVYEGRLRGYHPSSTLPEPYLSIFSIRRVAVKRFRAFRFSVD